MTTINLNADVGESFGRFTVGDDAGMMGIIKSASIACGFHAGDPTIMAGAVRQALAQGVSIGAHPGFNDLWGFGRRQIKTSLRDLEYMVTYQIGALQAMAHGAGGRVTHVKPHGALNNMAHDDADYATAVARGIRAADPDLIFVANCCSEMVIAGHAAGLRVAHEAYVDRRYEDSGQLRSRKHADALITDADAAVKQVLAFMHEGAIVTHSGQRIPTRIDTFCTHGDEPAGTMLAGAVRRALEQNGVQIVPLTAIEF